MEKLALRPGEVAAVIGIGRTRVYELIHSGELPAVRVGSSFLIPADALKIWLANQEPVVPVAASGYTRHGRG